MHGGGFRRRLTSLLLVTAVVLGMVVPLPAFAGISTSPSGISTSPGSTFKALSEGARRSGPTGGRIAPSIRPAVVGQAGIMGTVTNQSGAPLAGITVNVYTPDYEWVDDATTAANGTYLVTGLQNGQYKVEFCDWTGYVYADQWYDGMDDFYSADVVNAIFIPETEQGGAANIDAVMSPWGGGGAPTGVILGDVRDRGTNALLDGIRVILEDMNGPVVEVVTDPTGSYEFDGLEDGAYWVKYIDPAGDYATEYYRDAWFPEDAEAFVIGPLNMSADPPVAPGWEVNKLVSYEPSDILVTQAGYDDFSMMLDNLMWNYRVVDIEELAYPLAGKPLSDYSVIFANCSVPANLASNAAITNIKAFVEGGGALYASDWAYPVVAKSWPDAIDFGDADPRTGKAGDVTADIWDDGLAWWLDSWTIDLTYNLDQWAVPYTSAMDTTDFMWGTPPTTDDYAPLASQFYVGDGSVLYTTFHNEAQLTDTQENLLVYFALMPYVQDYLASMDEEAATDLPGYTENEEWADTTNDGETSSARPIDMGGTGTAVMVEGSEDASLDVQVLDPSGKTVASGEFKGSSAEPLTLKLPGTGATTAIKTRKAGRPRDAAAIAGQYTVKVTGKGVTDANAPYAVKVFTSGDNMVSVAGPTRIDTAIQASQASFLSADTVILATAFNFPDALGGSSLAGALDAPLLLTNKDSLPAQVETEIKRLGAKNAIILGSDAAVGAGVANKLATLLGGAANVKRIGGADRYATAALIAAATVDAIGGKGAFDGKVFVATGENFPDALAASPIAAAKKRPILLTRQGSLPDASANMLTTLGAKSAFILGSSAAVSDGVANAVKAKGAAPTRLAGGNRYQTAIAVAKQGVAEGLKWDGLGVATGTNYPDALAGGVMCGKLGSIMLLTDPNTLTPDVKTELTNNKATIATVRFLGSTSAVSQNVRNAVAAALK